ncbi:hypothetical protein SAMN04487819_114150 [Actinopolyspora alba]|uniref:Uncharacterized protein n=1 Tax=Actinopolyspora alba TaxID=673379 RepID=A0A1I2AVP1_9ACTN|nr:hypothetical protein SAMN04487819_114150 [Actinopolyspora alba]
MSSAEITYVARIPVEARAMTTPTLCGTPPEAGAPAARAGGGPPLAPPSEPGCGTSGQALPSCFCSASSARLAVDFTVPLDTPVASAISPSDMFP